MLSPSDLSAAVATTLDDTSAKTAELKRHFYDKFNTYLKDHIRSHVGVFTNERWNAIVNIVLNDPSLDPGQRFAVAKQSGRSSYYAYVKDYKVVEVNGEKCLVKTDDYEAALVAFDDGRPPQLDLEKLRICVPHDVFFEKIHYAHTVLSPHHAAKRTYSILSKTVSNIPREVIDMFINLCNCQGRKRPSSLGCSSAVKAEGSSTGGGASRNLDRCFNHRGLLCIVDMSATPYASYNFIMSYHDSHTKFAHLKPLQTCTPSSIAAELFDIFSVQGFPRVLQARNPRNHELVKQVIEELRMLNPLPRIVRGAALPAPAPHDLLSSRAVHPESEADVQALVWRWLSENSSTNWPLGCRLVQLQMNTREGTGNALKPYALVYGGQSMFMGVQSGLNLPHHVVDELEEEADLLNALTATAAASTAATTPAAATVAAASSASATGVAAEVAETSGKSSAKRARVAK